MRHGIDSKVRHYYIKKIYFQSIEKTMPVQSYVLQDSPVSACFTYMLKDTFLNINNYSYSVEKNIIKFFFQRTEGSPMTMAFYVD